MRGSARLIVDESGKGYNAYTNCSSNSTNDALVFTNNCEIRSPFESNGINYKLSSSVLPQTYNTPVFRSTDAKIQNGKGSSTQVTMISGGNGFALNYSLPLGRWSDLSLIGRGNMKFLAV